MVPAAKGQLEPARLVAHEHGLEDPRLDQDRQAAVDSGPRGARVVSHYLLHQLLQREVTAPAERGAHESLALLRHPEPPGTEEAPQPLGRALRTGLAGLRGAVFIETWSH